MTRQFRRLGPSRPGGCARFAIALSLGFVADPSATLNANIHFTASAENSVCARALDPTPRAEADHHEVGPRDLIQLRDIGAWDDYLTGAVPISISPDGHWIAFTMRRAMPETNTYCVGTYVLNLDRPAAGAKPIDTSGEFIRRRSTSFGLTNSGTGLPLVSAPQWSADGRFIAYLRQKHGHVRVWIASFSKGKRTPASPTDLIPTDFRWDRRRSLLTVRGVMTRDIRSSASEARGGYHYDERFTPIVDAEPHDRTPAPPTTLAIFVSRRWHNGAIKTTAKKTTHRAEATVVGKYLDAWLAPLEPGLIASPRRLHAIAERHDRVCIKQACANVLDFWWSDDHRSILFLAMTGPAQDGFGVFQWTPTTDEVTRLIQGPDLISGCAKGRDRLVCTRESSTKPREIVEISSISGKVTEVFDPNPEFRSLALPIVRRLDWTNGLGIPTFGDLVLPPSARPGQRLPLVVVQYDSRGFLRGGTGDEYPILPLAMRGFAVLSLTRPRDFASARSPRGIPSDDHSSLDHWNDRMSVQSSIEGIIHYLIADEIADPRKLAITGLSDGAAAATFALINSKLFSTAILSTCCEDAGVRASMGLAYEDYLDRKGWPKNESDWAPISIRQNASKIEASILIQAADREYRLALPAFQALKASGKDVDLYVFNDEYHVKWQPAHRLAIYDRVIAWLTNWANFDNPEHH